MFKKCKQCNGNKKIEEFNKRKESRDGYNPRCRECTRILANAGYIKNKAHIKLKVSETQLKVKISRRIKLFEYLKSNPCIDCGESNPIVLDCDHRDGEIKFLNVSAMVNTPYSWKKIEEEIKKCDVRCSNCHRLRTAKQFNWYSYIPDIKLYL